MQIVLFCKLRASAIFYVLFTLLITFSAFLMAAKSPHMMQQKACVVQKNGELHCELLVPKTLNAKVFTLENPSRIVFDLQPNISCEQTKHLVFNQSVVSRIRCSETKTKTRMVLDTAPTVKAGVLHKKLKGSNLVTTLSFFSAAVDQKLSKYPAISTAKIKEHAVVKAQNIPVASKKEGKKNNKTSLVTKPLKVVIDPGHGGHDSGAKGLYGTLEKDVALGVSRHLASLLRKQGMQVVLTRNDDRFLSLRRRLEITQEQKPDLFISIHADAFVHRKAKGASVFVLSDRGGSSAAARWLAQQEKHSGKKEWKSAFKQANRLKEDTQKNSISLGQNILSELGHTTILHKAFVERAGFMVLKSLGIPSVLVETGFISHPPTEKSLKTNTQQLRIAQSIALGVNRYAVVRGKA